MSDGLSAAASEKALRRNVRIGRLADYGLVDAVSRAGGQLLGLSVKFGNGDVLVTLRVLMPKGRVIAFVGAETLGAALIKAARQANNDGLKWKDDRYAR